MLKRILSIVLVCTLVISLIIPTFSKNDITETINETTTIKSTVEETTTDVVGVSENTTEVTEEFSEVEETEEEITEESVEDVEETTIEEELDENEASSSEIEEVLEELDENEASSSEIEEVLENDDEESNNNEASPSEIEEVLEMVDVDNEASPSEITAEKTESLFGTNEGKGYEVVVRDPNGEYTIYVVDGDGAYDKEGGTKLTTLSFPNMYNGCYTFDGYYIEGTDTKVTDNSGNLLSDITIGSLFENGESIIPKWIVTEPKNVTKVSRDASEYIYWWKDFDKHSFYIYNSYKTLDSQGICNTGFTNNWRYNDSFGSSYRDDDIYTVYIMEDLKPKSLRNLFSGLHNLTQIIGLEKIDTSECVMMDNMFNGCKSLTELDLSTFDTSKITSCKGMFSGCENLQRIISNGFAGGKSFDGTDMFKECYKLGFTSSDGGSYSDAQPVPNGVFTSSGESLNYKITVKTDERTYDIYEYYGVGMYGTSECNDTALSKLDVPTNYNVLSKVFDGFVIDGSTTKVTDDKGNFVGAALDGVLFTSACTIVPYWVEDTYTSSTDTITLYISNKSYDTSVGTVDADIFWKAIDVDGSVTTGYFKSDSIPTWRSDEKAMKAKKVVFQGKIKPLSMESWFEWFIYLKDVYGTGYLDTSDVTSMRYTFNNCFSLEMIDLSSFDTTKVGKFDWMFGNDDKLTTIYSDDFEHEKHATMWSPANDGCSWNMFADCFLLKGETGRTWKPTSRPYDIYDTIYYAKVKDGYFTSPSMRPKEVLDHFYGVTISEIKVDTGKEEYSIYENFGEGLYSLSDCSDEKILELDVPTHDNPEYFFGGFMIKGDGTKVTDKNGVFSLKTFKGLSFGEEATIVPAWYYTVKKVVLLSEDDNGMQYEYKTIYRGDGIYYSEKNITGDKRINVKEIKPTRENYQFVKFVSLDGTEELKGEKTEKAKTYKAVWTPNKYTINFMDEDKKMDTMIEEYGVGFYGENQVVKDKIKVPTRENAIFKGYYSEDGTSQYVDENGNFNTSYLNNKTFVKDTVAVSKFEYPINEIPVFLSDEDDANLSAVVFKKGNQLFDSANCDEEKDLVDVLIENQSILGSNQVGYKWWPDKPGYEFDNYYAIINEKEVPVVDISELKTTEEFRNSNGVTKIFGKWNAYKYIINLFLSNDEDDWRLPETFCFTENKAYDFDYDEDGLVVLEKEITKVDVPVKVGASFLGYYTENGDMYIDAKGNILLDKFNVISFAESQGFSLYAKFSDNLYELQLLVKDINGGEFVLTSGFFKGGKYYKDLACTIEISLKEVEEKINKCKDLINNVTDGALVGHNIYVDGQKISNSADFENIVFAKDLKVDEKNKLLVEYK